MNTLIREVTIFDPNSNHHQQQVNVWIKNGVIESISNKDFEADEIIEAKGMILSMGWVDMNAHFNDPGFEYKEDISSGCELAAASGFTEVVVLPNTNPTIQSKSTISYIKNKCRDYLTKIHPLAAVTVDTKGEDLTEMIDLHHAGAVAFSDGIQPIWHTDIMVKSLIYLQKFDGLLINQPEDQHITRFGAMNEGVNSTSLGVKGMPELAEHLMIKRDIELLKYAGGKLHFSNISSAESVVLINDAKKQGLNVTCDVSINHLLFTDDNLLGYDSNYKCKPPFRLEKDRMALIDGVKNGTIDAISSSHRPHEEESKKLEFEYAEFGLSSLQTFLPNVLKLNRHLNPEDWLPRVTSAPRRILNLASKEQTIEENTQANLTLFDPEFEWMLDDRSNLSMSQNNPSHNKTQKGKVIAVFNDLKSNIYI